MYSYYITGRYHTVNEVGETENKHFAEEISATTNSEAMELVLGKIWWQEQRVGNLVGLDFIHYEVLNR